MHPAEPMIRTRRIRSALAAALALVVVGLGCTTTPKPAPDSKGGATGSPKAPEEQFTGRSLRLFEDAVAAFEEQKKIHVFDWVLLERKFKAVVEADDRFAEAYYNLGVIYERQRKPEEAKLAYQTALQKKPSLKQAAENLAVMYQNEGRHADAVALYQEILRIYPEDGAARARMAALYREAGDHQRAMSLAREALMRERDNLTAHKVMMRCYLGRNNLNMARLVALRATRLQASDPELHYTMGLISEREGNEAEAIAHFQRAVKERDDFLAARVRIAEIASRHQDWSTAGEQYRKIVEYEPNNHGARVNLGVAYKGLGEIDKAMAEYDAAIQADPSLAVAHFNLGVLFHRHKDVPEKAIEHYKKFIASSRETIPATHPVFENVRQCEQYIRQLAEMKAAEERARKEEEERKRLEEQKKREEEEKARAEEKAKEQAEQRRREEEAKKVVDAAMQAGGAAPQEAAQPAAEEPEKPAPEASKQPAAQPVPEQPSGPESDEPTDEPGL
ncbi:MAG: adventurous gliding motility TPR repeat lipoprotein GltE [Myxococcales bacterium]|jgi:tetratricopeptide (TPR) repeat protein